MPNLSVLKWARIGSLLFLALYLSPAIACECELFDSATSVYSPPETWSEEARVIRDFSLYAHRRIVDGIIQGQGIYFETVLNYLHHCHSRSKKTAWLRQLSVNTPDTAVFANRIAGIYEAGAACNTPRSNK